MFQDAAWTLDGEFDVFAHPVAALFPIESAMEEIGRAARDIAFCESADAIACGRISVLRDMIAACRTEIAQQEDDEVAAELLVAIDGLGEDLASFEETLPLERAFRADQRDHAVTRIEAAQSRLRGFIADPQIEAGLFDPRLSRAEVVDLAEAALARSPAEIVASARAEAKARLAGAPIPSPEGAPYHFTQPEGWMAWLVTRIAERVGQRLTH
ncbi:MAG: hypothetical protein AB7U46_01520 [Paenirhodobacter sp.]|uniref:hypothetical protein n=1 Tax=Paenirhodobacter sp. TaxID=1965326 RepID=UPI003D0D26BC